jgi:hypothetical protein
VRDSSWACASPQLWPLFLSASSADRFEVSLLRMNLRRRVAVHGTRAVVLELSSNPLDRGLSGVVTTHTGLHKPLQLVQGYFDLSRWAWCTRSSPPTRAVSETLFGALKVASQPARCSIVFTVYFYAPASAR